MNISFTTSALRSMPMELLPETLLMGFMKPGPLIEHTVCVGEYLRQLCRSGVAIELIVDDGRPIPMGWRYYTANVKTADTKKGSRSPPSVFE